MDKKRLKTLLGLHIMLMIYSMSGICSKKAATVPFFSLEFCFYYGLVIALLAFYAIGWQQVIKQLPLTTAFANKSITVVWGVVWGSLFFEEIFSLGKLMGILLVIIGVILFVCADREE